jgi:hypothetical protein
MVLIITDAVPKDFLISICSLMDFRYLAQAPQISDQTCMEIDFALKEFHDHKDINYFLWCTNQQMQKGY